MTERKLVAPFSVKAVDEDAGTFEGYAATWDLDLGDDVIHRGAFKETIEEWRASGKAMPLLNSHNYFDVFSGVGQMLDAEEDKRGLWTKWEVLDGEEGGRVLARLRPSKRTGKSIIGSMSIGYVPIKWDMEDDDGARSGVKRNLRKVGLREVSLVLFPMNPAAEIDAATVKSALARHAAPDDVLAALALAGPEAEALVEAMGKQAEGPDGLDWGTPGNTPLDILRMRRMRSRSTALKAGIITHYSEVVR